MPRAHVAKTVKKRVNLRQTRNPPTRIKRSRTRASRVLQDHAPATAQAPALLQLPPEQLSHTTIYPGFTVTRHFAPLSPEHPPIDSKNPQDLPIVDLWNVSHVLLLLMDDVRQNMHACRPVGFLPILARTCLTYLNTIEPYNRCLLTRRRNVVQVPAQT